MTDTLLWIAAAVLVGLGIAGTLLPVLPGVPLVFLGLLLAAWIDGFGHVGWPALAVIGALAGLAVAVDLFASTAGAKRAGAGRLAMIGAAVGTAIGLLFGLPGLIVGPFVGAAVGQRIAGSSLRDAGKAGLGAWAGLVVGTLAKLALALAMVAVFVAAWAM
jgi:uncharacterized protein YqgC (DUF456 family)